MFESEFNLLQLRVPEESNFWQFELQAQNNLPS